MDTTDANSKSYPKLRVGDLVRHVRFGRGRIVGISDGRYIIQVRSDLHQVPFTSPDISAESRAVEDPELEAIKRAVAEVLGDQGWIETDFEMSKRWLGGSVQIISGKEGAQPKEIPLEVFFKKIIGIREKLRVLEQKINNHPKLDAADKLELEAYITRCYGSLTTFNVLFAEKPSQFRGSTSE
jgi:hypothetical protein